MKTLVAYCWRPVVFGGALALLSLLYAGGLALAFALAFP